MNPHEAKQLQIQTSIVEQFETEKRRSMYPTTYRGKKCYWKYCRETGIIYFRVVGKTLFYTSPIISYWAIAIGVPR